jgi:hypothetical protein
MLYSILHSKFRMHPFFYSHGFHLVPLIRCLSNFIDGRFIYVTFHVNLMRPVFMLPFSSVMKRKPNEWLGTNR